MGMVPKITKKKQPANGKMAINNSQQALVFICLLELIM
jgi:hypothetical protein